MFDCKRLLKEISNYSIVGIYGKPRAGKTTLAAGLIQENKKLIEKGKKPIYDRIYCTDDSIQDCYHITYKQFGRWNVKPGSLIILEECGAELNNREFKKNLDEFRRHTIAKIGHHKSTILWSSQSANVDLYLRQKTHLLYMVKPFTRHSSIVTTIKYEVDVDNELHDIVDIYHKPQGWQELFEGIRKHFFKIIGRKKYYQYFDSYNDDFRYPDKDPADIPS